MEVEKLEKNTNLAVKKESEFFEDDDLSPPEDLFKEPGECEVVHSSLMLHDFLKTNS